LFAQVHDDKQKSVAIPMRVCDGVISGVVALVTNDRVMTIGERKRTGNSYQKLRKFCDRIHLIGQEHLSRASASIFFSFG
jgi:hypothetical protein